MLKYYVKTTEALKRLCTDQEGLVSFEYVIVAACIIATVGAAFGSAGASTITATLMLGLSTVITAFTTAIGG
jgi:pilus assembly protein Flp/PilA